MLKFLTGLPLFAGLGIPPLPNLRESTDQQVENHWVGVKTLLLQTFVYTHEERYRLLKAQAGVTLDSILERHRSRFSYSPAKLRKLVRVDHISGNRPGEGLSMLRFEFDASIFPGISSEELLAMCLLSYRSPRVTFPGETYPLVPNSVGHAIAVDYLIDHRQSTEALFLKGLFCKYGFEPMNDVPDLVTARDCLVLAANQGHTGAKQELDHLAWHARIERDTAREPFIWPARSRKIS